MVVVVVQEGRRTQPHDLALFVTSGWPPQSPASIARTWGRDLESSTASPFPHHDRNPPEMFERLSDLPPGLQWPVGFMVGVTTVCYVTSEITGNVSQVDRLWALLPFVYTAYFSLLPLWPTSSFLGVFPYLPENAPPELSADYSPRALLMLVLTVRRFHSG